MALNSYPFDVISDFEQLGLNETVLTAIKKKGFEEPTPIQQLVIPLFLKHEKDIVAQAQTGTGKTAAFGLPLVHLLKDSNELGRALILTPTRELALQVYEELVSFAVDTHLKFALIYGGQSYTEQLRRLKQGVQIVVGTPGRILDLIEKGKLNLTNVGYLVLDEADEMLNLGFLEDVEKIINMTPKNRRILLFSATMPKAIMDVAKKFMDNPELIRVPTLVDQPTSTAQIYYEVEDKDKFEALCRIADSSEEFYAIVFCRTKVEVDALTQKLIQRGYEADCLHGDLSQSQRELVLKKFRERRITILVATDVAARGIDIQDLSHVINFHLPQDSESYIHRIGRTGRAGKTGTAITLITPSEFRRFRFLQKDSKQELIRQNLPNIETIIKIKKQKLINEFQEKLQESIPKPILELGEELKAYFNNDEKLLAVVLASAYGELLDPSIYRPISEVSYNTSNQKPHDGGLIRLQIALGKDQGYTPRKIVELIKERAGTRNHKISDVQVFAQHTYVTVPFREAEFIIRKMQGLVNHDKAIHHTPSYRRLGKPKKR